MSEGKPITGEEVRKTLPLNSKNKIIWLAVAILLLGGVYFYSQKPNSPLNKFFKKGITQDEAKAKVEKFIADNGGGATVGVISEENGLYKIIISANGQEIPTYVTKDGSKFFPQAIDFAEVEKQIAEAKKKQEEASQPAPKSDKPIVDLYVMSFCPYGNKAEDTIKSVYELLKNKTDFNFHYIVSAEGDKISSLHGEKEVVQNEREDCVLKNYGKDKWMNFVTYVNTNCGSDGSCWEAGAKSLAIDAAKINSCVNSEGLALMKAEADASSAAGASGSPTMTINGQTTQAVYQYGNSEGYKKAICDAFNTAPTECSKTLSSSTSTSQGGSCATQ
jgi:hypothetical protein